MYLIIKSYVHFKEVKRRIIKKDPTLLGNLIDIRMKNLCFSIDIYPFINGVTSIWKSRAADPGGFEPNPDPHTTLE